LCCAYCLFFFCLYCFLLSSLFTGLFCLGISSFSVFSFVLLGLSLMAMCFNLMQEEVRAKFRRLGNKLGIIDDPNFW